jgi:hypothetical protein
MKATQSLHNLGQSIWLDNITRDLLNSGTLKSYIAELSVTGRGWGIIIVTEGWRCDPSHRQPFWWLELPGRASRLLPFVASPAQVPVPPAWSTGIDGRNCCQDRTRTRSSQPASLVPRK